jgi:hypothetical protein
MSRLLAAIVVCPFAVSVETRKKEGARILSVHVASEIGCAID